MAITRTSFSTGDVPTTAEWNLQFDSVYNQVNSWLDNTGQIDVAAITATSLDIDNINIDGNTISSTDTNGDINITPNGTGDLIATSLSSTYKVESGITASVTQTQGQGALTSKINEISSCANVDDTVTLPSAIKGDRIYIINNGANRLKIFPASGDNLGNGSNTAGYLGNGDDVTLCTYDSTNWVVIGGTIDRTLDIGDWNMDADASVSVAHGLNIGQIRGIKVTMRNDANSVYYNMPGSGAVPAGIPGHQSSTDGTNVVITREAGGSYDSTGYDSTSFNRGWVIIKYIL